MNSATIKFLSSHLFCTICKNIAIANINRNKSPQQYIIGYSIIYYA